MLAILLVQLFYILSFMGAYRFVHVAHNRGGRWSGLMPNGFDLFLVFAPLYNTVLAILWILGFAKEKRRNLRDFFRIKD